MKRILTYTLTKAFRPPARRRAVAILLVAMTGQTLPSAAQNIFHRIDKILSANYQKVNVDTAYITRPKTKWTITARYNLSGARIEAEGVEEGKRFHSRMNANYKSTLSVAVNYLGFSLSMALNPAKLLGRYRDYELNFNSYGKSFGWDIIYQNAHNFTGWHDHDGKERTYLPADILSVKTLNLNVYYAFNSRRFSYPAAFSQSYIQRHSAGSFLLAASGMAENAKINWNWNQDQETKLKMTNIGIGAGYGYNFVPSQGWLLHISALPTFIFYDHASMTFGDSRVSVNYRFPDVIITGRGAVVRQRGNKFYGLSMVYTFTDVGDDRILDLKNTKWRARFFFGLRL